MKLKFTINNTVPQCNFTVPATSLLWTRCAAADFLRSRDRRHVAWHQICTDLHLRLHTFFTWPHRPTNSRDVPSAYTGRWWWWWWWWWGM